MKVETPQEADHLRAGADAALAVVNGRGEILAGCSLWWTSTPRHLAGLLGHYHAQDDASAAMLLEAAEARLRETGCDVAIGPMDGNTWQHYRLVTESDGRPPFFLEPHNPPEWPEQFLAAGWRSLARYTSSAIDLTAGGEQTKIGRVARRLDGAGVNIRKLRKDEFAEELRRIYEVSIVSFRDNFLYTPISPDDFAAMYLKIEKLLVPEFSLIAEDSGGQPVGFVFALPEPADPKGTIIVKSLAVLPERRVAGLGSLLVERVHRAARDLGFTSAIHALQHQANRSLRISSRHAAVVFREYTLFDKSLTL